MVGVEEVVASDVRHSAITSQSIGVPELKTLLESVQAGARESAYQTAIVDENVLGLKTATSREWRFQTLRRLYFLRPDTLLFRALRDLWTGDPAAHPILACLCALTQDTVYRSTAGFVAELKPGDRITAKEFVDPIEHAFPGAYKERTIATIAQKAYTSWGQAGHLGKAASGNRLRQRPICKPEDVAYALMIGHLEGHRGEALFDTRWVRVLDHPRSYLYDLAFAASQRGMLEFRNAGGVVEVGFRQLLRPMDGQLL